MIILQKLQRGMLVKRKKQRHLGMVTLITHNRGTCSVRWLERGDQEFRIPIKDLVIATPPRADAVDLIAQMKARVKAEKEKRA